MTRLSLSLARVVLFSLMLCGGGMAGAADAVFDTQLRGQVLDHLRKSVADVLELDAQLPLDASLRAEAEAIARAHVARIGGLLPAWFDEEWAHAGEEGRTPRSEWVAFAVLARLANEAALWHVEPGDAAYEAATLAVLRGDTEVCASEGRMRGSEYALRILRIQAMPASQRAAALATERGLLARWGKGRTYVPAWPEPLPQDAAAPLMVPATAGRHAGRALPPIVAAQVLGEGESLDMQPITVRCLFQRWWLQHSLDEGADPAVVLAGFRYGTLILPGERYAPSVKAMEKKEQAAPVAGEKPRYPDVATRFQVTGTTTMRVRLNAASEPVHVAVAARNIEVNGIRGVRPVAFENVFDRASIDYAWNGYRYLEAKSGIKDGVAEFQLVWSLDEDVEGK